MRDYGKVHTSFWTSGTTRSMSEDARALALYLLTSPHNTIAGVFRLPDGYVCEDMQWSAERVAEGFRELLSKGFANRCETSKWVWIRKHFDWNPPENPNQRKAAGKQAMSVPDECSWKPDFMRVCADSLGLDPPKNSNPSETLPKPFANQEQEQEQKQEQKKSRSARSPSGSRLPEDWNPTADMLAWARTERADIDPVTETENFRDHWLAKTGKDATKLDWNRTWRKWIRNAYARPKTKLTAVSGGYQPLPGEV